MSLYPPVGIFSGRSLQTLRASSLMGFSCSRLLPCAATSRALRMMSRHSRTYFDFSSSVQHSHTQRQNWRKCSTFIPKSPTQPSRCASLGETGIWILQSCALAVGRLRQPPIVQERRKGGPMVLCGWSQRVQFAVNPRIVPHSRVQFIAKINASALVACFLFGLALAIPFAFLL